MEKANRVFLAALLAMGFGIASSAFAATAKIVPDKDAYVDANQPSVNYGSNASMYVRASSLNNARRLYIGFDLSAYSPNTVVTSAKLYLYIQSAPDSSRTHNAYRVTSVWSESGIKWNVLPTNLDTVSASASTGTFNNQWKFWNVTSDTQSFLNGSETNYGWIIKDALEGSSDPTGATLSEYYSKEKSGTNQDPYLELSYSCAPGWSGQYCADPIVPPRNTNSALLNGTSSVTVLPGADITAAVTGIITSGADWDATQWRIAASAPGSMTCSAIPEPDHNSAGTYTEDLTITAPGTPGTYNAYFRIHGSESCSDPDQEGTLLTLANAVIVASPPPPFSGTISGTKFKDLNANGSRDEGEPGISGWRINLAGTETLSALTDADGNYSFTTLPSGPYTVCEEKREGTWEQTYPSSGTECSGGTLGYSRVLAGDVTTSSGNNFGNTYYVQHGGIDLVPTSGDPDSTQCAVALHGVDISVPAFDGGTTTVHIPAGTKFCSRDGSNFSISDLTWTTPSLDIVSDTQGRPSGILQWGIPGIRLDFDSPITIDLYVGVYWEGKTLDIVRSGSTTSGWTTDGIVSPATCTVTGGICSFQAASASYYVALGQSGGFSGTTPTPTPTPSPSPTPEGRVLGVETTAEESPTPTPSPSPTPEGRVLGVETCQALLANYAFPGGNNDSSVVKAIQQFLNQYMNAGLPVTGYYGKLTAAAVSVFQEKYADQVLWPWSKNLKPTGIVYKTTQRMINMLGCPSLNLPMPQLP